ncbi:MAG TPA: N-acetylmuramoyl-L-alanine amidase [Thermoanaerobaculia bacterium]|nr:N-acetylmuramoyl-L-alanine amidase [Thermoanaerobaculia bacterium]
MKRYIVLFTLAVLAVASLVVAQTGSQATLRTAAGDKSLSSIQQGGRTYFAAEEVITTLGGTIVPDNQGYRVTLNGRSGAFAPDSKFGVVRDDLIEMPAPPVVVDGKAYVPWQFFDGFLKSESNVEVQWDEATRVLSIRPRAQQVTTAQVSIVDLQGISKVVVELSAAVDYVVAREGNSFVVRFKSPIRPPFSEQTYENPNVTHASFTSDLLRLDLTGPDVAGNSYRLENPFRIIIDLKKGVAPVEGNPVGHVNLKSVDAPGIRTIVLDPGHGGKEVGAVGPDGLFEKDATLALCKKLSPLLASKLNARVILTRDDDSTISLTQRTAIANQYQADLFISIHLNASLLKSAHGTETYFLSVEASDELSKRAAERENDLSAATTTPAAASSSDLKLILWDLAQQEYLKESSRLAELIQNELSVAVNVPSRGVRQAPFKVLVGATMPAALVEVGFISNPEEEAKLKDDKFQAGLADAIVRAVGTFKTEYETRIGITPAAVPVATPPPAVPTATQAQAGRK